MQTAQDIWVEDLLQAIEDQTLMSDDSDPFEHLAGHLTPQQIEKIIRCAVIACKALNSETLFACVHCAAGIIKEAAQDAAMGGARQ